MKYSIFLLLTLYLSAANPVEGREPSQGTPSTTALECRSLRNEARLYLERFQRPKEKSSPKIRGFELLEEASQVCWQASQEAQSPGEAAELAALAYLSRASLVSGHQNDPLKRREVLTEAIEVISGIHHDQTPALIRVLRSSAIIEWDASPERGIQLMERALKITEKYLSPSDPQIAETLSELGFMHAPSVQPGTKPRSTHDPAKAEEYSRRALAILAMQDDLPPNETLSGTLAHLQNLLQAQGRVEEAQALTDDLDAAFAEEEQNLKMRIEQNRILEERLRLQRVKKQTSSQIREPDPSSF